jgi:uncharacterized protein (TIGR00303 family)
MHSESFIRQLNGTTPFPLPGARGSFMLCLAGTESSDRPDISAAGATAAARRLTPAIDAEILLAGRALSADTIPVSPIGICSPIVITKACLDLLDLPVQIIDCGSFAPPMVPHLRCGVSPAKCVSTGDALPYDQVQELFRNGMEIGAQCARELDYLIVAECVPGGTTTAMGVLTALGWNVRNLLSGSLPRLDHDGRYDLVQAGLTTAGLSRAELSQQPLKAIAAVGDAMQAFTTGVALGASEFVPVILGGGSQMLAVYALFDALRAARNVKYTPTVATTKWVAFDPGAATPQLADMIGAPYMAACPDFNASKHQGLRAYEEGNVKEGTGAGASLVVAHQIGSFAENEIIAAVDSAYSRIVERAPVGDLESVIR